MHRKFHASIHKSDQPLDAAALRARLITILVLLALVSYFLLRMFIPFFTPIIWAATLAIFVSPLQHRLNRRIRSKNLAALAGVAITFGLIIAPTVIIMVQVGHELTEIFHKVRDEHHVEKVSSFINGDNFSGASRWLQDNLGISTEKIQLSFSRSMEQVTNSAVHYLTGFITDSLVSLVFTLFIVFTLFFFLRDGKKILTWILHLLPMHEDQQEQLIKRVSEVIHATLFGSLMVAGQHGLLIGIMFYLLGIPGALLWTIFMMILAVIPVIGSVIVWLPATIWLLATGHIIKAIILLVWCGAVAGGVDHLVRPMLVGRQAQLHSLAVFYGVLGGLKVFGPIGLVLGPVIIACFFTLIDFIIEHGEKSSELNGQAITDEKAS